jgi:hypothetical protein
LQVLAVGFANFRYFFPQLCDVLSDGSRHEDRLAEDVAVALAAITPKIISHRDSVK